MQPQGLVIRSQTGSRRNANATIARTTRKTNHNINIQQHRAAYSQLTTTLMHMTIYSLIFSIQYTETILQCPDILVERQEIHPDVKSCLPLSSNAYFLKMSDN